VILERETDYFSGGVLVAHAYNPSYSEGRDQEDHSTNPAHTSSLQDPISKNIQHKKELEEWLKV
jgi:hypothetical protein